MGTIQGSSADISRPRRPYGLTNQELAILAAMYFTGLLNHRLGDLVDKDRDAAQTLAALEMLQQRGLVWVDRLNVYHLTEAGTRKILEVPDNELENLLGATTIIFDASGESTVSRPIRLRGCAMALLLFFLWFSATWGASALLDRLASALVGPPTDALRIGFILVGAVLNIVLLAVLLVAASSDGQGGNHSGGASPQGRSASV